MCTIICQSCEETIEHYESEKVSTLYGKCMGCEREKRESMKQ